MTCTEFSLKILTKEVSNERGTQDSPSLCNCFTAIVNGTPLVSNVHIWMTNRARKIDVSVITAL